MRVTNNGHNFYGKLQINDLVWSFPDPSIISYRNETKRNCFGLYSVVYCSGMWGERNKGGSRRAFDEGLRTFTARNSHNMVEEEEGRGPLGLFLGPPPMAPHFHDSLYI